jgi:hypothetical protein
MVDLTAEALPGMHCAIVRLRNLFHKFHDRVGEYESSLNSARDAHFLALDNRYFSGVAVNFSRVNG